MMKKLLKMACILDLCLLWVGSGWAVNIEFVSVGNPGNAADSDTGLGRVDYDFNMGKYDITAGQYCEFLNAVAAKSDPYGLYSTKMDVANNEWGCNIVRTVTAGGINYSVASDWANRPVNCVSWGDAARFCNWLQNGQKMGMEDGSTTETGAYALNGAMTNDALMAVNRGGNARYFIPNLNEWEKAGYYDPIKPGGAGYWMFPTKSNTPPINILDPAGHNNANCWDYFGTGNGRYTIGSPYFRSEVGAFAGSPSPYGTFDQGGNVANWLEDAATDVSRSLGGAGYTAFGSDLSKWPWGDNFATLEDGSLGFRVGCYSVPEPGFTEMVLTLLISGSLWLRICSK